MKRKIIDYAFYESSDPKRLLVEVNSTIEKEGYEPLGGISTTYDHNKEKIIYTQAMVKYEDSDK